VHRHRRGSLGVWLTNFRRSDLPLPERIAVTARNLAIRVTGRQGCCGHDGEPGC
jgi:hypothetical protein